MLCRASRARPRRLTAIRALGSYPEGWLKAAEKELRGKKVETLETKTAEGITLKPLYTAPGDHAEVPGAFPFKRGPYATMYTSR